MALKYCDHGLYGAAAFTASISSTTMTVTAVSAGQIGIGSEIVGASAGTVVTGLGSGTGGNGTYTVNNSQTLASSSLTAKFGAPATTPAWGVAQDGDGTAIGAATPATVAIDLSAATAAAGATISVMGAVLTCVASGAGNNQFNAGSGATLVSNLVAAINRAGNTSTLAAQATGWSTPRVQDAVFARIGSPTTTLEIMTRAGSAQYNSSQVATSGLTGGTFGPYTFAGGAGGAWGWLLNFVSLWPSGVYASTNYGLLCSTHGIAGALNGNDNVRIRSGKLIVKRQTFVGNAMSPTLPVVGAANAKVRYEVDDSTTWSDGSDPVLVIEDASAGAGVGFNISITQTAHIHLRGKTYSDGRKNLVFRRSAGTASNGDGIVVYAGGPCVVENVRFETTYTNNTAFGVGVECLSTTTGVGASGYSRFLNCEFSRYDNGAGRWLVGSVGNTMSQRVDMQGCTFALTNASSPSPKFYEPQIVNGAVTHYNLDGCVFTGFPVGSRLHGISTDFQIRNSTLYLRNCVLGGFTVLGPNVSGSSTPNLMAHSGRGLFIVDSATATRAFVMDTLQGFVAWEPSRSYPTLSARLYDGVTPWSLRMIPSSTPLQVNLAGHLESPRLGKINTLGTGARTATVELLLDTALSWTLKDVGLVIEYVDSDGVPRVFETYDPDGAALTSSTAAWSATTFSDAGTINYNKFKFTFTTPLAVLANSEMSFFLRVYTTVANSTRGLFFDPEVLVT